MLQSDNRTSVNLNLVTGRTTISITKRALSTTLTNPLNTKRRLLYLKTQFVPRRLLYLKTQFVLRRPLHLKTQFVPRRLLYLKIQFLLRRLLYLKTQFVPRSKHFSSRLYKPTSLCCKWHKSLFVLR